MIFLCALAATGCSKTAVPGSSTVIRNCTIIDGNGGPPLVKGMVVIDDGKIWAVGPESKFRLPGSVKQLDAEQGFVLPGLINTHVHISNTKSMESWTRSGVTTVRDLGGPLGIV
ncbi:MAG TPA: hypothetical protein VNU93_06520, partial [Verrucomicrobiae bacterium]|nr:hypothetical protein [Verrucomicrobiae bacterium]